MTLAARQKLSRPRASRRDAIERIRAANAGRDPERVALKYAKIAGDPFAFFRGTAALFFSDWPAELRAGPRTWCCGDLHLENFGSFKGANGLTYYDVNDFDEAILGPPLVDPGRYLVSLHLAAGRGSAVLAQRFVQAYREALAHGVPGWVERANARGVVRELLRQVKRRRRGELLATHVENRGGRLRLRIREGHSLPAPRSEHLEVRRWLARLADPRVGPSRGFQILDVVRRVVGTGSLGVARWIALARSRDLGERLELLDLKEARPSAAAGVATEPSARWSSEAERVVGVQRRMQASAPRYLHAIVAGQRSFVVRTLQPRADKLAIAALDRTRDFDRLVRTAGAITAWNQLRSSGRGGAPPADDLIAWARDRDWPARVQEFARRARDQVLEDWQTFRDDLRRRGG